MINTFLENVERAIAELRQGKMLVLLDDHNRENEADLIYPAENITPEAINVMLQNGSGIVCLALTTQHLQKLALPLMVPPSENSSHFHTAFTVSIEAKHGVTTGVSAHDRAHTIRVAVSDHVTPDDIGKPGHVFPLQAKEGGVLARNGHTEGAIDIVRLAGFKSAAVLCELMNKDGSMMKGKEITRFAKKNGLNTLTIADLVAYRLYHENIITEVAATQIPLAHYGVVNVSVIKEMYSEKEHIVISKDIKTNTNITSNIRASTKLAPDLIRGLAPTNTLVRIHSACFTGETLGSLRCDCHQQLHYALQRISQEGGILIYLNQEGRGIGLMNKIKAYALQDKGLDTVEANTHLGLPVDDREYYIAAQILKNRQIEKVRLLTNNPAKIESLLKYGMKEVLREPIPTFTNMHNEKYLAVKKSKLNHLYNDTNDHHPQGHILCQNSINPLNTILPLS